MQTPVSAGPLSGAITDFCVRRLTAAAAAALSEFYQTLPEQSRYYFEPYRDVTVDGMGEVAQRSVSGVDLSFVAIDTSERVIAHFFFMEIARETPHLGIGLREDAQGFGLGRVFLAYLIAVGRRVLHKNAIGLTVMKTNARALRLYQQLGFQIVREDVTFRSLHDSYEMKLTY